MENKLIYKLSNEIRESTKKFGGIYEYVEKDENKHQIASWLNMITSVSYIQAEDTGFKAEVNNKKYHNCYFKVSTYSSNPKAMFISAYGVEDDPLITEESFIDTVSVFNSKVDYNGNRITVKEEWISTLRELGIVLTDKRMKVSTEESHSLMDYKEQYFGVCDMDIQKLKEYCKDWNYQYE